MASTSTSNLLSTLASSLQNSFDTLPQDAMLIDSPQGISLLDVKNELLLSYLQNLVFLILFKLRNDRTGGKEQLNNDVTQKLVELRIYLEKGVRPLQGRMKYQIEKVLRAADAAERNSSRSGNAALPEAAQDEEAGDRSEGHEESEGDSDNEEIDELAYRPNISAFSKPDTTASDVQSSGMADNTGIYKPPKLNPTVFSGQTDFQDRKARSARKPQRSHTIDDFIDAELSTAPVAEPSIGSTIVAGGRHTKSDKERRQEDERTAYEEANFTRLPPVSKKERAKQARRRQGGFGGEELRGLGEGLDRIERLTSKKRPRDAAHDERTGTRADRGQKRRRNGGR